MISSYFCTFVLKYLPTFVKIQHIIGKLIVSRVLRFWFNIICKKQYYKKYKIFHSSTSLIFFY